MLKDEGHRFVCEILGEGPLRPYLECLIEENGLSGTVLLRGKVFQEEILDYYQHAHVFVLSSVQENLPNVLLESLAAGTPVVATRLAGTPELIRDESVGVLVEPGDPAALSEAVRSMLVDDEKRELLSRNGLSWVRKAFDIERSLDRLQELYRGVLDARGV
jgi:glycosyltransferase involved in cell wall biosynthesis